jgi:Zn-dependent peptidase ImmA (M78 family)
VRERIFRSARARGLIQSRDPEEAAALARQRLGVGTDGPLPDMLTLLEAGAGLRVFVIPLSDEGIDGAFTLERGEPFVLVNQLRHPVRLRFTLAHEYGHFFLDHGPKLPERIDLADRDAAERDANAFAAAFLMPPEAISRWFAAADEPQVDLEVLVRFAAFFGVSGPAARYRLETVNRISARRGKALDDDIAKGRHSALKRKLGLDDVVDSLWLAWQAGGHVPIDEQFLIASLLGRDLIDEEAAVRLLRVREEIAHARLARLAGTSDTGTDAE